MKAYLILLLAIVLETIATSFLKQSEQFTRLLPTIITVAGYAGSFYCLSLVLKTSLWALRMPSGREWALC